MEKDWDEVYKDLCTLGFKMKRLPNEKQVYEKYLQQQGWEKHKQPKAYEYNNGYAESMKKFTVDEFTNLMNFENKCLGKGKKIIVSVANHLTCIEVNNWKYEIVDTWDCGRKCVGNYWTKA